MISLTRGLEKEKVKSSVQGNRLGVLPEVGGVWDEQNGMMTPRRSKLPVT